MGLQPFAAIELNDPSKTSYDAASTGTHEVARRWVFPAHVPDQQILHVKLILSYVWAETADGRIQLYNYTDGVVVVEKSFTGGESSVRDELLVSAPWRLKGKELGVRIVIDAAGGTGEAVTLRGAMLEVAFYG